MTDYYCSGSDVKDRMLIDSTDTTFDVQITGSINEAMAFVDGILASYTTVPLTGSLVVSQVRYATADFATAIFKRRNLPEKLTIESGTGLGDSKTFYVGWWSEGMSKLNQYIKNTYCKGTFVFVPTGSGG